MITKYASKLSALLVLALLLSAQSGCGSGAGGSSSSESNSGGGGATLTSYPVSGPTGNDGPNATPNNGGSANGGSNNGGGNGGANGGAGSTPPGNNSPQTAVSVSPRILIGQTTRDSADFTGTTSAAGNAEIDTTVSDTTSFQVLTAAAFPGPDFATLSLVSPAGLTVVSTNNRPYKTLATFFQQGTNALTYPTNGDDLPVSGGTYHQLLNFAFLTSQGTLPATFTGTVVAKRDEDLSSGVLRVNVFFVGSVAQQDALRPGIESALSLWTQIYSNIGVDLDIQRYTIDSATGVLPSPGVGDPFYLTQSGADGVRPFAVNIFLGTDIDDPFFGTGLLFGVSGGIPGPAVPSVRSGVAVSINAHLDPQGVLTVDGVRVLAETMAHESGHYLGLFHPIEIDFTDPNNAFILGDPLADTPYCATLPECVANGLVQNLMFPSPVGNTPQEQLTLDQGKEVNLQPIVD